jgi:hypothetical protein
MGYLEIEKSLYENAALACVEYRQVYAALKKKDP